MILVVGATGQLGGDIAGMLLGRGDEVRVLVRDGSAHEGLAAAGAQVAIGDLKDPPSVRAAFQGVDAVVTTATATARGGADSIETVDRIGTQTLIDAAAAAGVQHLVLVSALGADLRHPVPLLRAKGEAEDRLRRSSMGWTVLQPNMFYEKLPMLVVGEPAMAGRPVTLVGEGVRRHSMVATRDVAAFAVAALDNDDARDRTLVIGGPQAITWHDVVAAFEHELGTPVHVERVPLGQPVPGLPAFISEMLAGLETYDSPIDSSALAAAFGITPTPLADVVRDVVATRRQGVA
jgi:NADH dehydrogenase